MELIGGQALIEGVMMRYKENIAMAVRKGNEIIVKTQKLKRNSWFNIYVLRGFLIFFEILVTGIKALTWSANIQEEKEEDKMSNISLFLMILLSFVFVVLVFILLPYLLTYLIGFKEASQPFFFNLVDGLIKVIIFILYLLIISRFKDVYRLFQYHGAEHKAIACYEAKEKLSANNVKKFPKEHPRCGTSFIIITLAVSIVLFALIPVILKYFFPLIQSMSSLNQKLIYFPIRILIIPFIMGLSYEALRLSAKFNNSFIIKPLTLPGILLQKITTKEPSTKMIEVAVKALNKII